LKVYSSKLVLFPRASAFKKRKDPKKAGKPRGEKGTATKEEKAKVVQQKQHLGVEHIKVVEEARPITADMKKTDVVEALLKAKKDHEKHSKELIEHMARLILLQFLSKDLEAKYNLEMSVIRTP